MNELKTNLRPGIWRQLAAWAGLAMMLLGLVPDSAMALPLFNRQTGQNCVACHAGGQFPELTPYGRMFKMTGYTIGERTTVPASVMAMATVSKVANTTNGDPANTYDKNSSLIMPGASLFLGGKVTDNIGAFVQITYDNYSQAADGTYQHHTGADNIDVRYADRLIDDQRDLIFGFSLNNNPSVSDPWNTAAAWMQYVPVPGATSSQYIDGAAPYPGFAPAAGGVGQTAGLTGYAYWNRLVYAELGAYRTANGLFRPFSAGGPPTELQGLNPYLRVALNREWGAHSLMVGLSGMNTKLPNGTGTDRYRDTMLDSQYQYLLDPHSVTAQVSYSKNRTELDQTAPTETSTLRTKLTYIYQAKYGGSIGSFNQTGDLATTGTTLEAFVTPVQNIRVGLQYTAYGKYGGASSNYDTFGRNASDNNSLFFYVWAAY